MGNRYSENELEEENLMNKNGEGCVVYTKCQKCGKKLTDPESMRRGYGPECWSQVSGLENTFGKNEMNEEIPGQMNIFDFPEALPDGV